MCSGVILNKGHFRTASFVLCKEVGIEICPHPQKQSVIERCSLFGKFVIRDSTVLRREGLEEFLCST